MLPYSIVCHSFIESSMLINCMKLISLPALLEAPHVSHSLLLAGSLRMCMHEMQYSKTFFKKKHSTQNYHFLAKCFYYITFVTLGSSMNSWQKATRLCRYQDIILYWGILVHHSGKKEVWQRCWKFLI